MTSSVVFGKLILVVTSFDLGGRRPTFYSERHNGSPVDHSCQISDLWDVNCGRESTLHRVSDIGDQVAIIY